MSPFLTSSVPIWVSRETADGNISHFSVSGWLFLLIALLVLLNFLAWSGIGLYEAVRVIA